MSQAERISYVLMAVFFGLTGLLHLPTLLLTILFGYFALRLFSIRGNRFVGISLYLVAVVAIGYGLFYFGHKTYVTLPKIADETIPAITEYAERHKVELPFSDYTSLRKIAVDEVKDRVANFGGYLRSTIFEFALLIIGLVVAASLHFNARWRADDDPQVVKDSLYALVGHEMTQRFITFYRSFAKVIGAQIAISTINTSLTAVFLLWNHFPYTTVLIALTFLCGLLPIIGNIMSNTLIVGVAFTISPKMALISLLFLIIIHKLEYFLNSKIIGDRIKNPMWMTLLAIVLGEELMGIPGMILAPVILHYVKVETSKYKFDDRPAEPDKKPDLMESPAESGH
ncbi:MAG: AI-2E family transporter [Limisphaerales bacterium]|jgi:predicted PurR-regulated permease PerM